MRTGTFLDGAFDPGGLRQQGEAVLALLVQHLEGSLRREGAVMPRGTPAELCLRFPPEFSPQGDGALVEHIERALRASTNLQSPRFVGHQVATPLPAAALCDLVAAFINNGMAVFEMGPAASAMERAVLRFLAEQAGLPATSGGVLTSGGSLGNLTALLAARQAAGKRAGFDIWRQGLRNLPQLCILVADTAHYSVARAARMLGLGDHGVILIETDERLRMRPSSLATELAAAKRRQKLPIAVVASAASTAAGAYDPLEPIADLCAEHGVWLHVDGAHGASLLLSEKHRHKLAGVGRADSLCWDAHKLMLMPALITAVLFRDAMDGAAAFAQEAGYLFEDDNAEWAEIGKRTVECTKRMMSLKLYACLRALGTDAFAAHIDTCCALATEMAAKARARGLEVLTEPECNIVCFRPPGIDGGKLSALRRRLLEEGAFYLVQLHRKDGLWLRCTFTHPLTTGQDLDALLDAIFSGMASL